jgi:putative pyruvate formate lyase activating enzyme
MTDFQPAYLHLLETGELRWRVSQAYARMSDCCLCGQECGVDRTQGELGVCRTGDLARLTSYGPHLGEEDPLRGMRGSGTIFFGRCNLRCQYCQNYDISQRDSGQEVEPTELAAAMLALQNSGCHNINFVSPSHVAPQIMAAVLVAAQAGLRLPLVYNTGGYDSLETLALLDGVIDIYMPDMKYADPEIGLRYSRIRDYPRINQDAVREMHRQVGDLQMDERGIAIRGLLVRHLVLPNVMDQYRPAYRAHKFPALNRRITREEYQRALDLAREAGLTRLDQRRSWPWQWG